MKGHKWFAAIYDKMSESEERKFFAAIRRELIQDVSGEVLEIGAGTGLNFPFYPAGVHVVATEPDPYMLKRAQERAKTVAANVELRQEAVEELTFPDSTFDFAIGTLVLCSVRSPRKALAEIKRVLKPGGEFRLYEHVRSRNPIGAFAQDAVVPVWSRLGAGCHPNRDTERLIGEAGFEIVRSQREMHLPPYSPLVFARPNLRAVVRRAPHRTSEVKNTSGEEAFEMTESSVVAQGYDAVYDAMPRSPTLLRIWKQTVAGDDYPDAFYHISFLTLQDLRDLKDALKLSSGSRFADLACGMGGPALWITRETGSKLWGVDFSRVAVAQAEERATALDLAGKATFSIGTFDDTGLDTASMDAVMTVDALQYAPSKLAAIKEFARILRPGGRLAFAAFELDPSRTAGLPAVGDDPVEDYRPLLASQGFDVLAYEQTPQWHDRLTTAYRAVIAAQKKLREEMGPLATAALLSEMTLTLERDMYCGRVFVVAERRVT